MIRLVYATGEKVNQTKQTTLVRDLNSLPATNLSVKELNFPGLDILFPPTA